MPDRIADYRAAVRAAVRGVWTGAFTSANQGSDALFPAIRRYFLLAFNEGMAECGVKPEERTEKERKALVARIKEELSHVPAFMKAVYDGRKGSETERPLAQFLRRAEMWVGRYNDVRNQAKVMACGNQKLEWVLRPAEHCPSCIKLAGKIKRASFWKEHDVRPQHPTKLQCMINAGGPSVCKCMLVPTDRALTPGPLPKLP